MPNVQHEDFENKPPHHPVLPALNQIASVRRFITTGGQTADVMNIKQTGFYIGMQLEELAEELQEVIDAHVEPIDQHSELFQAHQWMNLLAKQFKEDRHHGAVLRANREKLLDGFIDSIVVSSAGALSYSHDAEGAFREVNRANMDKFPGGVATRDENGKIQKPAGWKEPDLTPFVRPLEADK